MQDDHRSGTGDDAYAILGVGTDASDDAIALAYKALARRHHPDLAGESETRRMSRINAAFDRLRDPLRRAAYDQELEDEDRTAGRPTRRRVQRRPANAPTPAPPPDPGRPSYGWTRERDGTGGAGPAPGRPSGSVLGFGRHVGWSIGEIARVDPGYLEWLEVRREGRPYAEEINETLVRSGYRPESATSERRKTTSRGRR